MKKSWILMAFMALAGSLSAQHYGGVSFTPYAVENSYGYLKTPPHPIYQETDKKATFGYSVGYMGLLMPQRRFSFAYGFQYFDAYNESSYINPVFTPSGEKGIGDRVDVESLQVPLTIRYNILKNKKWQPFIAFSTIVNYALRSQQTYFYDDGSSESQVMNSSFYISVEYGVGVSYTSNDWMLAMQPIYGGNY